MLYFRADYKITKWNWCRINGLSVRIFSINNVQKKFNFEIHIFSIRNGISLNCKEFFEKRVSLYLAFVTLEAADGNSAKTLRGQKTLVDHIAISLETSIIRRKLFDLANSILRDLKCYNCYLEEWTNSWHKINNQL